MNPLNKKIYKKIKKYDEIVICRHIGPDPDAVCSSIALRDSIKATFPNKKVYAVGKSVSRFKLFGELDKIDEEKLNNPLLIVLDLPNISRMDGVNIKKYKEIIKIDHHPFEDKMGNLEIIDVTACSASQLIIELIFDTKLKLTKAVAENLFLGVVSDSERFLFDYTTSKTFELISKLLNKSKINFIPLYKKLYMRPIEEIRFKGYISEHLTITKNNFAYIKIPKTAIEEYKVDTACASNMINDFNYIKDILVWIFITYDEKNELYKINMRSRGPIINKIANKYNGGGHSYACGARIKDENDVDSLIKDLDNLCKEYKSDLNENNKI